MKKIMFNDQYGLTQAVLEGKKTMTRRLVPEQVEKDAMVYAAYRSQAEQEYFDMIKKHSPYKVGEILAIAQRYSDVYKDILAKLEYKTNMAVEEMQRSKGWNNKMFVNASMMPHHIRIIGVSVEHLQYISTNDCLKEGVYHDLESNLKSDFPFGTPIPYTFPNYTNKKGVQLHCFTAHDAFMLLIDKVSGKGTWAKNPLVYAYSFELID